MTEWLKIVYDIMAGLGFLVTFVITIAFTWGIFLTFSNSRSEKAKEAKDKLKARVAPEVQREALKGMMVEAQKNIDRLNAEAADLSEQGKEFLEKRSGMPLKAGEENSNLGKD